MTLVLPAMSGVLAGRSPIVGVPAEAEAASRTLLRMREEADSSAWRASQSLLYLNPMRSTSTQKISAGVCAELLPGAQQLVDDLSSGSEALGTYSNEIERIHTDARTTIADAEQYLGQIRSCAWELERAATTLRSSTANVPAHWYLRPSILPPLTAEVLDDLTPAETAARAWAIGTWTSQAISWGWAADRVEECRARWQKLITQRCEAEQQLVSKLTSTTLGSLFAFGRLPSRSTITRSYTGGAVHPSRIQGDQRLIEILNGSLSPAAVAVTWRELGLSDDDVKRLPIQMLFALAKADGIPFRVQDIASNTALNSAIEHPLETYRMMGLSTDMTLAQFTEQLGKLKQAYDDAIITASTIPGSPKVQLFGFGTHDGALTAAISLGDADTATNVGLNVSGMGSNVGGIGSSIGGAEQLYLESREHDFTVRPAIITWVGYHSPAMPPSLEVGSGDRASAGAVPLARVIDGVNAVRESNGIPMREFVVLAHSYGSTTAAEALKLTETRVDAFVTYGSAGLEGDTSLDQLHADRVYSTKAAGDNVAGIGIDLSGRTDPREIDGVIEFSAEKTVDGKRVTAHDMFTENDNPSFWNWGGKVGYLTADTSAVRSMGQILAGGAP